MRSSSACGLADGDLARALTCRDHTGPRARRSGAKACSRPPVGLDAGVPGHRAFTVEFGGDGKPANAAVRSPGRPKRKFVLWGYSAARFALVIRDVTEKRAGTRAGADRAACACGFAGSAGMAASGERVPGSPAGDLALAGGVRLAEVAHDMRQPLATIRYLLDAADGRGGRRHPHEPGRDQQTGRIPDPAHRAAAPASPPQPARRWISWPCSVARWRRCTPIWSRRAFGWKLPPRSG